jgi:hypothetical protein
MRPTLSIISTFRETLQLGVRYWKLVLGVSLVTATLLTLQGFNVVSTARSNMAVMLVAQLFLLVVQFVISAMTTAAVLGVLKSPQNDSEFWSIIKLNIKAYTGTLIRLSLLLALFASAVTMPFGFAIAAFDLSKPTSFGLLIKLFAFFIAILYLVFVKFALANPLVVVEGKNAIDAIIDSWEMTKGRFGYVLGCYVFLGTADYFAISLFGYVGPGGFGFIEIAGNIVAGIFGCLWDLMAWCMYQQIKACYASSETPPPYTN